MTSSASAPRRLNRRHALGLGLVALAACAGEEQMRHDRIEAAEADAGESVTVDGVALNLLRAGADGGAPTVLIHGASGNRRDWDAALPALAARGPVVAFDRPGHGLSGWPGPAGVRLSEQARLMRVALRRLGHARAVLVGHSYGGSVALAWALDAPDSVAGLALLAAPSQVWQGGLGRSTDLLANPLTGPVLARALPALLPRATAEAAAARVFAPQTPPPLYLETLRLDLLLRPATLRANATQLAALRDQIRLMAPHYPRLAMPVEILHGDADVTVPLAVHSEPLARQLSRGRLTRLAGIGHMPHHVALPELLAALDRLPA
jgi:pimeloyl-ACP methyl ester carboxylesterase